MGAVKNFYHDDICRIGAAEDGEYENEWLPALIAFYRADCAFQRAENLRKGWTAPDATDLRLIEALKAAFEVAP